VSDLCTLCTFKHDNNNDRLSQVFIYLLNEAVRLSVLCVGEMFDL